MLAITPNSKFIVTCSGVLYSDGVVRPLAVMAAALTWVLVNTEGTDELGTLNPKSLEPAVLFTANDATGAGYINCSCVMGGNPVEGDTEPFSISSDAVIPTPVSLILSIGTVVPG